MPSGLSKPKTLAGFDFTHQIRREIFELVRDDTNYTVDEDLWVPPELPGELHTARWSRGRPALIGPVDQKLLSERLAGAERDRGPDVSTAAYERAELERLREQR